MKPSMHLLKNKKRKNKNSQMTRKPIALLLLLLLTGIRCASSSNEAFIRAQKQKNRKAIEQFLQQYPESPQTLMAKIELEKYTQAKPPLHPWSSETTIALTRKGEVLNDSNGYLKKCLSFYDTKKQRKSFIGANHTRIVYDYFPVEGAKKAVIISHGTGESSVRYAEVVYDLLQNQFPYSIFIINHRGHGYSDRLLGKHRQWNTKWNVYDTSPSEYKEFLKIHADNFTDYVRDFGQLVELVKKQHGYSSIMAIGHSLGGGVITRYLQQNTNSLEKAVLSAPMMSIQGLLGADNHDYLTKAIVSTFDTFHHTGFTFGGSDYNRFQVRFNNEENTLNYYTTSKKRFYFKQYLFQKYPATCPGSITWGFTDTIYEAVKDIRANAQKIQTPILILQAENDNYVHPSGQNYICQTINQKKAGTCQKILIKAAKHELFLERDRVRNQVMDAVWQYLIKTG